MYSITSRGSTDKAEKFCKTILTGKYLDPLAKYGREGVAALSNATPKETGLTAESWTYEVVRERGSTSIVWSNTHVVSGVNISVILQYGHGTGTGGYVAGRDYINPALRPIFDRIANEVWKVVTSA